MTLTEALAGEIRDRANQQGMRARQVAAALDLAEISYNHRLRGIIDWRMDELARVAALFNVELDELFASAQRRRSAVA